MTEYIAAFAPETLPDISYLLVDSEQISCAATALERAENQANFEVSFLPLHTDEQKEAAATEWAGYLQAKGQMDARLRGAFVVTSTEDKSPAYFLSRIEDELLEKTKIEPGPFVAHAVARIVKLHDSAMTYELFREYYEPTGGE